MKNGANLWRLSNVYILHDKKRTSFPINILIQFSREQMSYIVYTHTKCKVKLSEASKSWRKFKSNALLLPPPPQLPLCHGSASKYEDVKIVTEKLERIFRGLWWIRGGGGVRKAINATLSQEMEVFFVVFAF